MATRTLYTKPIIDKFCALLASGLSMNEIAKMDGMPAVNTVLDWLHDERKKDFWARYADARNKQADALADSVIALARTPMRGTKVTRRKIMGEDGLPKRDAEGNCLYTEEEVTADMIEHRRLQIDTIKWYAGKVRPKKYGDRTQLEVTGSGGGPLRMTAVDPVEAAKEYARLVGEGDEGES